MLKRMTHTIMIPDDIWEWGVEHFGVDNPADNFRLILAREQGKNSLVKEPEPKQYPSTKQFKPDTYSDPFPATFSGFCWGCGAPIHPGDLICMKNKRPYLFKWVRENT